MSHILVILNNNVFFEDKQMILLSLFDISIGFRFPKNLKSLPILVFRHPCAMQPYAALSNPMQHYATLCNPMQPYAMLCNAIQPYETLCNPMQSYAMLCNAIRDEIRTGSGPEKSGFFLKFEVRTI